MNTPEVAGATTAGRPPAPPSRSSTTRPGPADYGRGRRLVERDQVPGWLHELVDGVHEAEMAGPLRELSAAAPGQSRRGAVLMLFGEGTAGPDVLLTERAATMRSHAGQPAFPGGALDPGEDAIQAALREGAEETGLVPESVVPLALLPELYLPPSDFLVRPVLAFWREPGAVRAVDPAETAVVVRVPIAELVDPANRGQVQHPSGYVSPGFQVAELVVWGFTAGLVDVLLDVGGWSRPWDPKRMLTLPAAR